MKISSYSVLIFASFFFLGSCSSGCVDCTGVSDPTAPKNKFCKDDFEADYPDNKTTSWESFRNALRAAGCKNS